MDANANRDSVCHVASSDENAELAPLWDALRYSHYQLLYANLENHPWLGHVAFANILVQELRPGCIVELGTHWGNSYFAFCQAVREAGCATRCYSVDTWEGDPQASFYGSEVFDAVNRRNEELYSDFSTLKRMRFDEARPDFAPNSIDILHIDGLHFYENVREDFESWIDTVKPGGIVLLHDTNEFQEGFGAPRFWDELSRTSPEHHLFRHSHGLGVWRKPGGEPLTSPLLKALLTPLSAEASHVDAYCAALSQLSHQRLRLQAEEKERNDLHAKIAQMHGETAHLNAERDNLHQLYASKTAEASALQARVEYLETTTANVLGSLSWKITAPLRWAMKKVRAACGGMEK